MNVYVRELARALGQLGHRVDIYTRAHDVRDDQIYYPYPNVRLIHINAGGAKDMGKLVQYCHLPDFISNLEDFTTSRHLGYDLIHSHYWLSGQVGQWLSQSWQVPNLIMFHTLGLVKNILAIGDKESELRLQTEQRLVSNCHHIITATTREKGDLVTHFQALPEKIKVIPCGINLELFQPMTESYARRQLRLNDDRVILFVGRIEPLKGIDRLLAATSHLKDSKPKLLIVGGDDSSQPEVARLTALAQKLGISESVSFPGSMPQSKLPLYYNAADICVIPSFYETFSLVILESLACGTPVVSTDVGFASTIIRQGQNGYVVAAGQERQLAMMIERSLSLKKKSNGSIRESVTWFDWTNIARAVLAEYYSVLARKPVIVS
jgi:D-inositol-3-phosphate glycosyltransferase